jgi:NAD(P)-dependent dehydrogenase (short-subunit alcohol dehydrogenase family)
MQLEGKRGFITGAGSGIGRATARAIAAAGAAIVVSDLDDDAGAATVGSIVEQGGTAHFVHCDVTKEDEVDQLLASTVELLGGLDYAVNNVGLGLDYGDLHQADMEMFDRMMDVTVRGTFLCMRAELGWMVEHGGGSIVNTASGAGTKNAIGMPGYTAAKHAVVGLTKNAGMQYAERNIRVNCVCPGTIGTEAMLSNPPEVIKTWTDIIPMRRTGRPEEVADGIVFLLSDQASFLTSVLLPVDGGFLYA